MRLPHRIVPWLTPGSWRTRDPRRTHDSWRVRCGVLLGLATLAILPACSGASEPKPCDRDPQPAGCAVSCGDDGSCPGGFFCGNDDTCTAECDALRLCGSGRRCSADGRCERVATSGDGGSSRDPNICAEVELGTSQVTPTVIVIVDQSSSMFSNFGGQSRWDALRDSLIGNDGIIPRLEDRVRFGLALYSAVSEDGDDGGPPVGECPIVSTVSPALQGFAEIREVYARQEPIEDTPTGDAIEVVTQTLALAPDREDPVIYLLATDGEPDRCEELDPQRGQEEAIAAVEQAFDMGIRTFALSVGQEIGERHLQDIANAGVGQAAGNAPFWRADDPEGLVSAIQEIVGGALSCEIELDGQIETEDACTGQVLLNGVSIPCDDPNGWRALSESRIELLGAACDELKSSSRSTVKATFPCDILLF